MLLALVDRLRDRARRGVWTHDQALGRRGEDLAHRFLRRAGFVIVARNYRLAAGDAEADIIARDGDALVIVEVKTRASEEFGPPDRAIGHDKQRALRRVAREYARKCGVDESTLRCDVVTVVTTPQVTIQHFRDAVGFGIK
jgi:putative endonuclease